ncbi:DUF3305 domain-containing protein [Tepidamorphus sp. 3E244]|uniref:DUF3305 domain-containing protein n=1 Tax=Tepidamorphus sp. 3E244 TaxID=3385498 RepID=UPI0038FC303C
MSNTPDESERTAADDAQHEYGADLPVTVSQRVSVVVERRPSENRWIDETWMPVGIVPAAEDRDTWRLLREADGVETYLAATLTLSLHRSEVEAYKLNLSNDVPTVLIVMTPSESGDMPYDVVLATCAAYEAEGYLMGGDELVEPVPMPPAFIAWVKEFADARYAPAAFVKRHRDKAPALVDHKFGKDPIFARTGRYEAGEDDGDGL